MSDEIKCAHCPQTAVVFNSLISSDGKLIFFSECKECETYYFDENQETITKEEYIIRKTEELLFKSPK